MPCRAPISARSTEANCARGLHGDVARVLSGPPQGRASRLSQGPEGIACGPDVLQTARAELLGWTNRLDAGVGASRVPDRGDGGARRMEHRAPAIPRGDRSEER